MRVRTSVYRNRYGTSAKGTIEATHSTSSALDSTPPACADTSTIRSSSTATPAE
jgi:hypothetical protein